MRKRQIGMIGSVLIVATILFTTLALRQEARDRSWAPRVSSTPQKDEATVVHRGAVTEKEREYSKEYKKMYNTRRRNYTFTELINKANSMGKPNDEIRVLSPEPDNPDDPDSPIETADHYLRSLSCKSDAIVIGSVKDKKAHMTDDEQYVYTEYSFSADEILKDNTNFPIASKSFVEVTRPGGIIELDGRRILVEDDMFPFLERNKSYLLFLRFIPSTKGYTAAVAASDFIIENDFFNAIKKSGPPRELRSGVKHDLLSYKSNFSAEGCSEGQK